MTTDEQLAAIAARYQRFARHEARGRSPLYEQLANAVAGDEVVLRFLAQLPELKRQPNLLFAAVRLLDGVPDSYGRLSAVVTGRAGELDAVMRTHSTQTNEAARCAAFLPVLATLPGPLALIEVGASAGLCLLPDRYSYDYSGHTLPSPDLDAPTITCHPYGPVPLPSALPEVVWRAGIDLHPLDVTNPTDMTWLRCLVWPEETDRAQRLDAAITLARRYPPHIAQGDLVDDLRSLAAQAPTAATLVIMHSAVLAYVRVDRRARFADTVDELDAVWLANEAPPIHPRLTAHPSTPPVYDDPFLLVRDGHHPLAYTDGHGRWLHWLPDTDPTPPS